MIKPDFLCTLGFLKITILGIKKGLTAFKVKTFLATVAFTSVKLTNKAALSKTYFAI